MSGSTEIDELRANRDAVRHRSHHAGQAGAVAGALIDTLPRKFTPSKSERDTCHADKGATL